MNWKDTTKIENSDRKKILDHIDNLMKKRVEAIMGANRRNYYGECAAYIAAIGEVKEKLGEKNVTLLKVERNVLRNSVLSHMLFLRCTIFYRFIQP